MKKLLFIILVILSPKVFSQGIWQQRGTSSVTSMDANTKMQNSFYLPMCLHAPSLNGNRDSLGALCYVRDSSALFYRDTLPSGGHQWTKLAATKSSNPLTTLYSGNGIIATDRDVSGNKKHLNIDSTSHFEVTVASMGPVTALELDSVFTDLYDRFHNEYTSNINGVFITSYKDLFTTAGTGGFNVMTTESGKGAVSISDAGGVNFTSSAQGITATTTGSNDIVLTAGRSLLLQNLPSTTTISTDSLLKISAGNVVSKVSLNSVASQNFANTNLTATGNRIHNWNALSFTQQNLNNYTISGNGTLQIINPSAESALILYSNGDAGLFDTTGTTSIVGKNVNITTQAPGGGNIIISNNGVGSNIELASTGEVTITDNASTPLAITSTGSGIALSLGSELTINGSAGNFGQVLTTSGIGAPPVWSDPSTGTVTTVSVVTANGFSGTVANSTTTPAITLTQQNATTSQSGKLTSTDWNTFNNKQSAITLTTTGTSGAATLTGATLNIPQYSGGGGSTPGIDAVITANDSIFTDKGIQAGTNSFYVNSTGSIIFGDSIGSGTNTGTKITQTAITIGSGFISGTSSIDGAYFSPSNSIYNVGGFRNGNGNGIQIDDNAGNLNLIGSNAIVLTGGNTNILSGTTEFNVNHNQDINGTTTSGFNIDWITGGDFTVEADAGSVVLDAIAGGELLNTNYNSGLSVGPSGTITLASKNSQQLNLLSDGIINSTAVSSVSFLSNLSANSGIGINSSGSYIGDGVGGGNGNVISVNDNTATGTINVVSLFLSQVPPSGSVSDSLLTRASTGEVKKISTDYFAKASTTTNGTYTPTLTNVTNVSSSTANQFTYSRQGNIVTYAGSITVTTSLAVASECDFSLPTASAFTGDTDLNGTGTAKTAIATNCINEGDAVNDRGKLEFIGLAVSGTGTIFISGQYIIK